MMQWRWTRISDHRESTFGGEPVDGRLQAGHHLLGHDLVVAVDDNRVQCLNDARSLCWCPMAEPVRWARS
jgi:hypothetical protein